MTETTDSGGYKAYNAEHGIVPKTVIREIGESLMDLLGSGGGHHREAGQARSWWSGAEQARAHGNAAA